MLYKDMTDTDLIAAYWATRNAMHNNGEIARSCSPGGRGVRTMARQMGRLIRDFDIICAVLRKRDVTPLVNA